MDKKRYHKIKKKNIYVKFSCSKATKLETLLGKMSNQVGDYFKFLWPFQDVQTLHI